MTHSPHQNTPDPEDYIPSFRRRNLDTSGFMKKLGRFAGRLGKPVVRQLYALYYLWESEHTPKRAKMIIVGALVYFLSPIDSIPDLRPLQNSFFPDSRNLNTGFRLFLFQRSTDSTQISP